jgi:hypothetical protein
MRFYGALARLMSTKPLYWPGGDRLNFLRFEEFSASALPGALHITRMLKLICLSGSCFLSWLEPCSFSGLSLGTTVFETMVYLDIKMTDIQYRRHLFYIDQLQLHSKQFSNCPHSQLTSMQNGKHFNARVTTARRSIPL